MPTSMYVLGPIQTGIQLMDKCQLYLELDGKSSHLEDAQIGQRNNVKYNSIGTLIVCVCCYYWSEVRSVASSESFKHFVCPLLLYAHFDSTSMTHFIRQQCKYRTVFLLPVDARHYTPSILTFRRFRQYCLRISINQALLSDYTAMGIMIYGLYELYK